MDFYELLEVDKNASKDEIKRAFRQKARKLHPDVNKEPDAEQKFKELGKAYETLMDDNKRALYDQYGEDGLSNAGYTQGPFDYGFGDISEIFSSFFGGGMDFGGGYSQRANSNAPQRGDDLRVDIDITFEEAVRGTEKEIKIDHLVHCDECGSTGTDKNAKETVCKTCQGRGKVQQSTQTILGSFTTVTVCPTCHGTGKNPAANCKKCHGSGLVQEEKTVKVKIPAGVDNGSKMRLSGEGSFGKNKGPAGDLYIVLYVEPSKKFTREEFDIKTTLRISQAQATLGDTITIETLDGDYELKIPEGTQSGERIELKGLGVPILGAHGRRGNHYVIIFVDTPVKLSNEERELYKKLFEIQKQEKKESLKEKLKSTFAGR